MFIIFKNYVLDYLASENVKIMLCFNTWLFWCHVDLGLLLYVNAYTRKLIESALIMFQATVRKVNKAL
jgi:hypothetical protein